MALTTKEFEALLASTKQMQAGYRIFLENFIMEMALRALAQTKMLTPVVTGDLRNHWELTRPFMISKDIIGVVMFNSMEYASFVEDGHAQHARWVPGYWNGDVFVYDREAKTGMKLREAWIPGQHMARISIAKLQNEIPQRYSRAFAAYLKTLGK